MKLTFGLIPRQFRLRYRLSGLLVAIAMVALSFGLVVVPVQRQKRAVKAIYSNGGWVRYRGDQSEFGTRNERHSRHWFADHMGKDWF